MTGQDGLRLADDLVLPLDAVTETFAILGQRGSGKTSTAVVVCEEMIAAGLPVVVIDPIGVWWGLRSSADGSEGLPVVIFGGDHADLPLAEKAGPRLADIIIDHRPPAVLDLSHLSKSASRRFVADFLERLYHRNRDPLHIVLDEADLWAPQRTQAEGARCLGAVQDVVRRGRARGLGCSLITQRPAVLNKDVLGQASVLVTLRMAGVRDVAAIDEWVRLHADDDEAERVKASLPSLPVGTAWVWSPGWLGLLQRVQVRARETFDSSATPKVGERRIMPQRLAPVDLDSLREQLADDQPPDPVAGPGDAELRRELAETRRKLTEALARPPREVTVPVLTADVAEKLQASVAAMTASADAVREVAAEIARQLAAFGAATREAATQPRQKPATPQRAGRSTAAATQPSAPDPESNGSAPQLKSGARRMLDTLGRHHPMRVTRAQLATLTGMKVTGGTFGTYYSTLRRSGLIDEHDSLTGLTRAGREATDATEVPASTEETLERWRQVLKAGARTMLDLLVQTYPAGWSRADLAAEAELEPSGGTFGTYLSTLRRNGLADVTGDRVTASDTLFLADAGHD